MGVWLGPRGGKPEPIALYTPGDTDTFTGVEFAYAGGEKYVPGAYYSDDYVTAAISSYYSTGRGEYVARSGLLVCGPVDLTKYKKIRFDYADTQLKDDKSVRFYVSASADSYDESRDTWVAASGANTGKDLNVSGLRGAHYVGIALCSMASSPRVASVQIAGITVSAD